MSFTYVRFVIDGVAVTIDPRETMHIGLGEEYTPVHSVRSLYGTHVDSSSADVPSFEIVKRLGKLTPLLAAAVDLRKEIEVTVKQLRPTPSGTEEHFLTMALTDVRVFGQEIVLGPRPEGAPIPEVAPLAWERIQLVWQNMVITDEGTGTETTLSWNLAP